MSDLSSTGLRHAAGLRTRPCIPSSPSL